MGIASTLLVIVLLLNFFMLGASRVRTVINASAVQGVVLGLLAIVVHPRLDLEIVLIAVGAGAVKGFLIPRMLLKAMRGAAIRREVEPLVGFMPSLLLCALTTGGALVFSSTLPLAPQHAGSLLVPTSLATVLAGFLLLITRRKAITQVVGYLVLENGIYVMGLMLLEAMPLLIEVGVLLDLLVAIFVMGIIINHINREFSSLDTSRLNALREE
jgi:hydrogenase-4 component E